MYRRSPYQELVHQSRLLVGPQGSSTTLPDESYKNQNHLHYNAALLLTSLHTIEKSLKLKNANFFFEVSNLEKVLIKNWPG